MDIVEKRLDEVSTIVEELSHIIPRDGWSDYAFSLLARLQKLAIILDDEGEDAEAEVDVVLLEFREDDAKTALRAAMIKKYGITEEELEQGWYIRKVNGCNIKFSTDDFSPMEGQMKALGGSDNAISGALKQKDKDEKTGKGKDKKISDNVSVKYKSPYPIEQISATGENHPCKGFAPSELKRHKNINHEGQYDNMTDEQYERHAINLLKKKCGKDIFGYRCSDGSVCRFNNLTGEFAKGYPGGYVKTCFYPTKLNPDGTKTFDLEYARAYFAGVKRKEDFDG